MIMSEDLNSDAEVGESDHGAEDALIEHQSEGETGAIQARDKDEAGHQRHRNQRHICIPTRTQ